jgi:hypothetical protein
MDHGAGSHPPHSIFVMAVRCARLWTRSLFLGVDLTLYHDAKPLNQAFNVARSSPLNCQLSVQNFNNSPLQRRGLLSLQEHENSAINRRIKK